MKLTINKKQHRTKSHSLTPSPSQSALSTLAQICFRTNYPRRVLIFPQSQQQRKTYQIIRLDCMDRYARVSDRPGPDQLFSVIVGSLKDCRVQYDAWLGFLCVHLCHHYQENPYRKGKTLAFAGKFRAAFEDRKVFNLILAQTIQRVQKYCSELSTLPPMAALQHICSRYQKTFLLQFIPVQYSQYVIDCYLDQQGDIEQYVRLCASLVDFVLNMNPVSQAHAVRMLEKPYMGTIQWPIVISNRHRFRAEEVYLPNVGTIF